MSIGHLYQMGGVWGMGEKGEGIKKYKLVVTEHHGDVKSSTGSIAHTNVPTPTGSFTLTPPTRPLHTLPLLTPHCHLPTIMGVLCHRGGGWVGQN